MSFFNNTRPMMSSIPRFQGKVHFIVPQNTLNKWLLENESEDERIANQSSLRITIDNEGQPLGVPYFSYS